MMYLLLGEMGYEIAQSNAAYILEEGVCCTEYIVTALHLAEQEVVKCWMIVMKHSREPSYSGEDQHHKVCCIKSLQLPSCSTLGRMNN